MDSQIEILFHNIKHERTPYIRKLINYEINDKEGFFYFDGYYYVDNKELPKRLIYSVIKNNIVIDDENYEIEVYKKENIEDTSKYGDFEDDDGSIMNICFFPMCEQKIYFKIIKRFDNPKDLFKQLDIIS